MGTLGEGGEGGEEGESDSCVMEGNCVSDPVLLIPSSPFSNESDLPSFDFVLSPNLFLPHRAKDEALDILSGDVSTWPSWTVPRPGLGDMIRFKLLSLTCRSERISKGPTYLVFACIP